MTNKRRGTDASLMILTAIIFLGKDNLSNAYIKPKTLLDFMDNARVEDIQEFDAFLRLAKERLRMRVNRKKREDRGGMPYTYENFIRPMADEGVKVPILDDILKFIGDYQAGKVIIDFTLDQLIDEAEKA